MTDYRPPFNQAKLDELVLYICERNLFDEHFGKTKLHKQLWMSEFHCFSLSGKPLVGATYVRGPHGPSCQQLGESLERMEDKGQLIIRLRQPFGYTKQQPVPLVRADLSEFEADEIALVEDILWETRHLNALELTSRAQLHPGWLYTEDGDEISYGFASVPSDLPFEEPWTARAQALAAGG